MEYLLDYMEDYLLEDLKETLTQTVQQILIDTQENVLQIIELLNDYGADDVYLAITSNTDLFLKNIEEVRQEIEEYEKTHDEQQVQDYIYNNI